MDREHNEMNQRAQTGNQVVRLPIDPDLLERTERLERAQRAKEFIATGWFASLEATFPDGVNILSSVSRSVEASLPNRPVLIHADGSRLHGVISLRSNDLHGDPEVTNALNSLTAGVLAGAAIRLTVFHDAMGVTSSNDKPELRTVRETK